MIFFQSTPIDPYLRELANLRHLYENMVREGKLCLAEGLLAPAIEFFEGYWEEKQRAERAEEEHFEKMCEWNEHLVRQEIEDTENYDY